MDDLSQNGVNLSVSSFEKIDLRALDESVWICKMMMCSIFESKRVDVTLSDGMKLHGVLHPFWQKSSGASKILLKAVGNANHYIQQIILTIIRLLRWKL